jgi:hypothetical protein
MDQGFTNTDSIPPSLGLNSDHRGVSDRSVHRPATEARRHLAWDIATLQRIVAALELVS